MNARTPPNLLSAADKQDAMFVNLALKDKVSDAADEIQCAISTVNDLLRLALDDLVSVPDTRADSAIRGAQRFLDDIGGIAARLHELSGATKGGVA